MIVSKKILNQWIDVRKISDKNIVSALNNLGFEVDKIVNLSNLNTNLIVGEILKIEKHPKSNKLNICSVNIGKKINKIVCGASNVRVGIKVVVAQIGSKLANGLLIESREILGVRSCGMICSLIELGLNADVLNDEELAGIVYLPNDASVGSLSALSHLNLDDTIFEIQLTLNRSDCLGMYYLAQELSHYFNLPLKKIATSNFQDLTVVKAKNDPFTKALASLKINLLSTENLQIHWINRTLQLANIKPKSFFENLISLVMLELGQPLATFAANHLTTLHIALANKDYLTKDFQFFSNDLLLSNQINAHKSEYFSNLASSTLPDYLVSNETRSLIFISLNVDNNLVQEQIKRNNLNLNNLFLQRLSKPITPVNYLFALKRILFLLQQFKIKFQIVSFIDHVSYYPENKIAVINYQIINQLLGTNFSLEEIISVFKIINCQILQKNKKRTTLKLKISNCRNDLNNVNDFAEEVARIIGYNKLPTIKPKFVLKEKQPELLVELLADIKNYLLHYGFHQVKTYSLTSEINLQDFNFFQYKKQITLIAPINQTRKVMRFSLISSLLEVCRFNASFKQNQIKVFTNEVIYTNDKDELANHHLAFVVHNDFFPFLKYANSKEEQFLLVKGFFEAWLIKHTNSTFCDDLTYQEFASKKIHPHLSSKIEYNNIHFATIATLHPETSKAMDLSEQVTLVEINFTKLLAIISDLAKNNLFFNWSKFNPLKRDLSIIISSEIEYLSIKNAILALKPKYLEKLILIDCYVDDKLKASNKRSLTFNLEFNSKKEQLDEEKISKEVKAIEKMLATRFHGLVR